MKYHIIFITCAICFMTGAIAERSGMLDIGDIKTKRIRYKVTYIDPHKVMLSDTECVIYGDTIIVPYIPIGWGL